MKFKDSFSKLDSMKSRALLSLGVLAIGFNQKAEAQCRSEPEFSPIIGTELDFSGLQTTYQYQPLRAVAGAQLELMSKWATPIFTIKGSVPVAGGIQGATYERVGVNHENVEAPYSPSQTVRVLNYAGQEKWTLNAQAYLGIGNNHGYDITPFSGGPIVGVNAVFTDQKTIVYPYAGIQLNMKFGDNIQLSVYGTNGPPERSQITALEYTGSHNAAGVPVYKEVETTAKPNLRVGGGIVFKF